jgi:hypothetical protein
MVVRGAVAAGKRQRRAVPPLRGLDSKSEWEARAALPSGGFHPRLLTVVPPGLMAHRFAIPLDNLRPPSAACHRMIKNRIPTHP